VGKKRRHFKLDEVRERFRLTPTEKRVAVFVAVAFLLGLITKCYRDAHPKTMMSMSTSTSKKTYETHAAQPGDPAKRPVKSAEILDLSDSATKQEEQQK
jgi:hypothetical protein